jgi:hypothetical protein
MANGPYSLLPAISDATSRRSLTTQQIGRLGELLVQYELLRYGIDSAQMSTEAGVDPVAFRCEGRAITLQVKTNLAPKPDGRGALAVDWWVGEDCPAELYAFADLSSRRSGMKVTHKLAIWPNYELFFNFPEKRARK